MVGLARHLVFVAGTFLFVMGHLWDWLFNYCGIIWWHLF
jgi:hypothetical protein